MWWLSKTVCLGILLALSFMDIQRHQVPVKVLLISKIISIMYYIIFKEIIIYLFVGGIGVGIAFLFISKVTREGIGFGDSWAILILGSYLGIWETLEVLAAAFSILSIYAVIVLYIRKMSRTYTIPFFPFLTGGYLALLLTKGGIL